MPSATPRTALFVGASRGIGLGLAKEFLARGWRVIATTRNPDPATFPIANDGLEVEVLDITEAASVAALRERLTGRSLDLLLISTGISNDPDETVGDVCLETFVAVMTTNTLAPMKIVEILGPCVAPGGTIAVLSSGLGSVSANETGGREVYRASKAALNSLMRSFAARQPADGPSLLLLTPGWVRTDMGGPSATLDVETSARGLADVIAANEGARSLQFLDYLGRVRPW